MHPSVRRSSLGRGSWLTLPSTNRQLPLPRLLLLTHYVLEPPADASRRRWKEKQPDGAGIPVLG